MNNPTVVRVRCPVCGGSRVTPNWKLPCDCDEEGKVRTLMFEVEGEHFVMKPENFLRPGELR